MSIGVCILGNIKTLFLFDLTIIPTTIIIQEQKSQNELPYVLMIYNCQCSHITCKEREVAQPIYSSIFLPNLWTGVQFPLLPCLSLSLINFCLGGVLPLHCNCNVSGRNEIVLVLLVILSSLIHPSPFLIINT